MADMSQTTFSNTHFPDKKKKVSAFWFEYQESFLPEPCQYTETDMIILMKLSSLAMLEVVEMTTSSVASDENFFRMTMISLQCAWTNDDPVQR